jgi:hypothetical protein
VDYYRAFVDPEILSKFLNWVDIQSKDMDDLTAFFLLMTFPYYEQEWDLVGFLLSSVFDVTEDGEENNHSTLPREYYPD